MNLDFYFTCRHRVWGGGSSRAAAAYTAVQTLKITTKYEVVLRKCIPYEAMYTAVQVPTLQQYYCINNFSEKSSLQSCKSSCEISK